VPSFYSSPKFRRWLSSLPPREELIARIALREDIREPGVSLAWEARIVELHADLIKTAEDWADLLLAVAQAKQEIAGNG
jgi:hypothetical protein